MSPSSLSRRGWLTAAAGLVASSCLPSGAPPIEREAPPAPQRLPLSGAGFPPPSRFDAWNLELRAKAPGRDVCLLDLDAIEENIDVVRSQLGSAFALRLVTKSLPSLELIEHLMSYAQTRRLMAFSEGMLRALLDRFGASVDILLGRPAPVEAARRALADSPSPARKVRWLVDTKDRLLEYRDLAHSIHHRLDVAIELDVGLRRGGARDTTELLEMLAVIAAHPTRLRFVGFMGYEGHVPFAPPGFDSDTEFAAVQARYADFVQAGAQAYPALFQSPSLVFDSGGSGTYYRYTDALSTPVNEVSLGSAFLLPAYFTGLSALGLGSAFFQASPILKRIEPAEIPFAEGYLPSLAETNPDLEVSYFMVAGAFPGDIVHPTGLVPNPIIPSAPGVDNLLPNQALRNGASSLPLTTGDFVFYHPYEGGSLGWLSHAEVFRDDHLVARWPTFQEGCRKICGDPSL